MKAPSGKIKQAMNAGSLAGLGLVIEDNRQQRAATVLADVAMSSPRGSF